MIKVTSVIFRFNDLNNGADNGILVGVNSYQKYDSEGHPTGEIEGYRYTFILHQRDFEKISIKVPSQKPIITSEELEKKRNNIMAKPVNCRCKFYWNQTSKTFCITATADDIILEG